MGLNSRLSEFFRLNDYRNQMETQIFSLQSTELALRTQIAFATSDFVIEAWARGEAHMAKTDDQVIVPIPLNLSTPSLVDGDQSLNNEKEKNWQIWWQLFIGD